MSVIHFVVPAVPVAQPRPRAMVLAGRAIMRGANSSHKVNTFKPTVAMAAKHAYDGEPLEGPLSVTMIFVMPRPKSMLWKKREMPRQWHPSKPDFDNLAKSVCDAISGIIWRDDSQLAGVLIQKWIAAGDEQPHVEITIRQLLPLF